MAKLSKIELMEMSIEDLAKILADVAEELNDRGAIGGMLNNPGLDKGYLASVHMTDERVPAGKGEVSYRRFDCGDTHDVERTVLINKVAFFNIMDKKAAKKLMAEEILA